MMQQALAMEVFVHVAALVVYAIATALVLMGTILERPRVLASGHVAALAGILVQATALGLRWYGSGHGPYISKYELLSAYAWVAMVLFHFVVWRRPAIRPAALILYPAVLIMLGIGVYTGPEVMTLPPTFAGIWLALHVSFYFVGFASALMALGLALLMLGRRFGAGDRIGTLPPTDTLDRESYRFAGLTFAFWGVGMLTGSIWAYYAWGRFWGWDPVETWSLVTWFAFGLYLHLRRFYRWRTEKAAWLLVACFILATGTLFFTSLIDSSLHAVYFK